MNDSDSVGLIDLVFLLLFSFMIMASFTHEGIEPPTSPQEQASTDRLHPLEITVGKTGTLTVVETGRTLRTSHEVLVRLHALVPPRRAEFIADREAPATLLVTLAQLAQTAGVESSFLVHVERPQ